MCLEKENPKPIIINNVSIIYTHIGRALMESSESKNASAVAAAAVAAALLMATGQRKTYNVKSKHLKVTLSNLRQLLYGSCESKSPTSSHTHAYA